MTPSESELGWSRSRAVGAAGALAAASVLVLLSAVGGRTLADGGVELYLDAPPFVGRWVLRWPTWSWVAVALAVALVVAWPIATRRLRWVLLLVGSGVASLSWSVVLAVGAGVDRLSAPLVSRFEYLPLARRVDDPGRFVRTFVERLPEYPTHVKGHPPGPVLALGLLDRSVGGSDLAVALVVLVLAATAAPASLLVVDRLAGRDAARRVAVFAGLAPAVVWTATSSDALFMAVAAWALALASVAVTTRGGPSVAAGSGAGLLVGAFATLTYGAPTLLAPVGAVVVLGALRRRWPPVIAAAAAALVLPAGLALAGFDWMAGFRATRTAYFDGVAAERPYLYFLVSNLAVLAVAVGPAVVVAVAGLRDRVLWWPVGGALVGALVADLSGLSKGEVERIWLPLVPAFVLATASLPGRWHRPALAMQLATALVLAVALDSPW